MISTEHSFTNVPTAAGRDALLVMGKDVKSGRMSEDVKSGRMSEDVKSGRMSE